MRRRNHLDLRIAYTWLAIFIGMLPSLSVWAHPAEDGESTSLNRQAKALLSDRCFKCHGPDENARKAKLRLDIADGPVRPKGKKRIVILPGNSKESSLIERIFTDDPDELMPPPSSNLTLSKKEKELLKAWINQGAKFDQHWSFAPIERPALPKVLNPSWAKSPMDVFVQARLEKKGWKPSNEATKATLIRRLYLTLLGLPPEPHEAEAYLSDTNPGAYERLVERVLHHPAFGERLAWDWLEAARYADSNGYQGDRERTMWPWRDWVVDAFNKNLPYDQFTTWQLAGDLIPDASFEQKLATGFCRNHMINGEGGRIPAENRVDYVMDMTETMGTVWLGLTLNCCRCHDHKYDPLLQKEYYSLFDFFNHTPVNGGGGDGQMPPNMQAPTVFQKLEEARLRGEITKHLKKLEGLEKQELAKLKENQPPEDIKKIQSRPWNQRDNKSLDKLMGFWNKLSPSFKGEIESLKRQNDHLSRYTRSYPKVMIMQERKDKRKTFVLKTGLYNKPTYEVKAGVPQALPALPKEGQRNRLALSKWIVSDQNPLTARVTVNRLWQRFFGRGLVKTVEDFGIQGELPSHPLLLDYLSKEFQDSGWNLKELVRTIVTSSTFRQSSKWTAAWSKDDPDNKMLSRGPRFRLSSWILRDQALGISGLLVDEMGGSPVNTYQPQGVWAETTFGRKRYSRDKGRRLYRRSLYSFWRRIIGPTIFFDESARQYCSVKMNRTNTPLHALTTLNAIPYVEAARALAHRGIRSVGNESEQEIARTLFKLVLVREPSTEELKALVSSYGKILELYKKDPGGARRLLEVGDIRLPEVTSPEKLAAWSGVAQLILNLDETLNLE